MNNTNRGMNRAFIFIIGLILVALGVVAIALTTVPAITDAWDSVAPQAERNVDGVLESTPLGVTGQSWLWIAVIAVCVILIALLAAFIFRQGHGQTARLVSRRLSSDSGRVTVESAVAEQSLGAALAARPEFVASHVSTYEVKGQPVLKISATARRGVSPREIIGAIEPLVRSWDSLLGEEIPVLVSIGGGFRTRVSKPTRLG